MPDLLAHLNEPQLCAVTLPAQCALILAGAGSGKTRVLTTRIAWLMATGQAGPTSILAVTFTNKAAREMTARLGAMTPVQIRGMWIGTFHGLANRMLRAHYRDAGLPQTFQILDAQDQLAAIKRLLKRENVDDQRFPPRNLMYFINHAKEQGLRPRDVDAGDDHERRMVELYELYEAQCQREGVVDFAELLLRSFELLRANELLREHYQQRFTHILVDEFQDTNALQYAWLKLLAGHAGPHPAAVFAVGDDDQSIYAFRGAEVGNMAAFERDFRVQNLIKLEQNYRSHGLILECANALIAHNRRRLGKQLWTEAGEGEPVRIYEAASDAQEAHWMVEQIRDLVGEGFARSDIAVLYRSNAQSRVIEHGLFSAGIAYRVYGGLRFFERAEIKHALAYLRLIEHQDDDGALLRIVNFPARGIGARSLEQLQDAARARGTSLFQAIGAMAGAAGQKLAAFARLIESLRLQTRSMPLPLLVEHVIEHSGLIAHYHGEREGEERIENLRELINAASAFLAEEGIGLDTPAALGLSNVARPLAAAPLAPSETLLSVPAGEPDTTVAQLTPLAAFLSHASLEAGDNQAGEGTDAVQLMTVHSAKGLEFQVVFITGLEEGLFPHENAIAEPDGLEEERRLMYVAITRARTRLYLSLSQTRMLHGQTRYNLRSRFLDELPGQALKWLTPRTRYGGGPGRSSGAFLDHRENEYSGRTWASASGNRIADAGAGAGKAVGQGFDRGVAWRVGQSVAHPRFGEGVILELEGWGEDARARINFGPQGIKVLSLQIAKLQARD